METVADDIHRIPVLGKYVVNTYLVGDVIVDSGLAKSPRTKILPALEGFGVSAHALTHAHLDHVAGSYALATALDIPVWASDIDASAVEEGKPVSAGWFAKRLNAKWEPVAVSRRLKEGDELAAGFVVVETPGHSPGHISFWRESDRVLIAGDVFANRSAFLGRPGLRHPPGILTVDVEQNKRSEAKLAALEPDIVVFGHGPVLRDAAPKLAAFVA